jgi:polyisoprenoid-binding protein YceI
VNQNMHKVLKMQQHADIRFRLKTLEPAGGAFRATGWLTVAGAEKEVTLALQVQRKGNGLVVTGGPRS